MQLEITIQKKKEVLKVQRENDRQKRHEKRDKICDLEVYHQSSLRQSTAAVFHDFHGPPTRKATAKDCWGI